LERKFKKKPLTDDKLAAILKGKGYLFASAKTVPKYRENNGYFLSARLRKTDLSDLFLKDYIYTYYTPLFIPFQGNHSLLFDYSQIQPLASTEFGNIFCPFLY